MDSDKSEMLRQSLLSQAELDEIKETTSEHESKEDTPKISEHIENE